MHHLTERIVHPTDRIVHPTDRIVHTLAFGIPVCRALAGGVRCSSVVRAFAHYAMGRRIDPSWGGPIELFLVPTIAP